MKNKSWFSMEKIKNILKKYYNKRIQKKRFTIISTE